MATLYYKTLKNSPTGVKIQSLINKGYEIEAEINKYMDELGAGREYMMKGRCVFGTGVCGVKFLQEPDMKIWKKHVGYENYYRPRLSSKIGKEIQEKFDSFDIIDRDEIGDAFGFEKFGSNPGYSEKKDSQYFGIAMDSDWNFTMPEEFTEITFTEYINL